MNMREFKIILKEIIHKEVSRAIKKEFELLKKDFNRVPQGRVSETFRNASNNVLFEHNPFSDILNETVGDMRNSGDQQIVEFDNDFMESRKKVAVPKYSANGKSVDPNTLPDYLLNVLSKNYSGTLKEIEKHTKIRRGTL